VQWCDSAWEVEAGGSLELSLGNTVRLRLQKEREENIIFLKESSYNQLLNF
jgi:hypothetical protein